MALIDNLVSYYKLDEASGNRLDAHGSNTLTDNNTVGQDASGKINAAALFVTANSEYFSAADNTIFDVTTGDFSVSFWYKGTDPATSATLFSKRVTASGQGFYAILNASDQVYFNPADESGTDYNEYRGSTDVADGTYKHIVITWDGTGNDAKIYVNGTDETVVVTDDPDGLGSLTNTSIFLIGAENAPGQYIAGSIDEWGFWTKVLSAAEVTELYNAGAGLAYPFTSAAANHWLLMGA